ncbi:MAG TPA: ATP-binding protein [Rhodothermales bacterium]|nr:ATP-binding protein [Rhodothermales bacterium]
MSDLAPQPPEESVPSSTTAHLSWGATLPLLLLVAIIAVGVAFGVTALRQQADQAQRHQLLLTSIRLKASELNTLAAETMEAGRLSTVADENYRRLNLQLRLMTAEARSSKINFEFAVRAELEAKRFAWAVEDEFEWLRLGRFDEARKVDVLRVKPGYNALSTTVEAALDAFDERAARIIRQAGFGTAILSLLGLAAIVGLLLNSSRQLARRARFERETLLGVNNALREENLRRRRTEEELAVARDRAEEMARLKDAFLASMSHEIRTPLMAILGYSELLREMAPPELRDYADQIEAGGHRLLDTLTSVLDFAKIEAGQMQPSFTVVDAVGVARGVESELRGIATRKGLDLIVDAPVEPVQVRGDSGFVHRALYNLVSNALKFTEHGEVRISVNYERDVATLVVRDTGPGISEEFLPHLFEEFRQESQGESRRHEGSGLGLAITRRLVECMHGSVEVQSRLGAGARFTLRLPIAHEAVLEQKPPQGDGAAHHAATRSFARVSAEGGSEVGGDGAAPSVLLLEDNETSAKAIGLMLNGYRVEYAASYDAAVTKARAARFDIFLLDINLREARTGVDVLTSIRRLPRYANTPAIALTAYALPGDEERFLNAGFDGYLSKPFRKAELHDAIVALSSDARILATEVLVSSSNLEVRPAENARVAAQV